MYFGMHTGLLRSDDGGRLWSKVPSVGGDAMGQVATGNRRIVAGHDVYYESDDGGRSWREARPSLPGTDVHAIAMDPRSGALYAYVVGFGLFRSSDGRAWTGLGSAAPPTTIALAVARNGSARLLAAGTHGLASSDDEGRSWRRIEGLGSTSSVAVVAAAPSTAFAVALGTLYRSGDAGRSWSSVPGAPRGAFLVAVSADGAWVYVVTSEKEVWRSEDAGKSWRRADG